MFFIGVFKYPIFIFQRVNYIKLGLIFIHEISCIGLIEIIQSRYQKNVEVLRMVLAEFSMFPTDKGESVSKYVSQILRVIDESGVTYQLTPMGTILEGEWSEVMGVITDCFEQLQPQCRRISTNLKVDYREGAESRMHSKIDKLETILQKKLKS